MKSLPHYLSLGAGVQSSVVALMNAAGEITPMLEGAIFSDTQAEPPSVYRWLDWLEKQLPFPVYRVTKGNLTQETLRVRHIQSDGRKLPKGSPYLNKLIPVFGLDESGKIVAALGRRCTYDFKIVPLIKQLKQLVRPQRGLKTIACIQWIGISYDEMERMKMPTEPWIEHRWPLVEMKMRRSDCLQWMKARGFPEPPRSACYYCPFHSDEEWTRLRDNDPQSWDDAIAFDKELRRKFREEDKSLNMEVFLHSSCKPLSEVKFRTDGETVDRQLNFDFRSECEGMCGL